MGVIHRVMGRPKKSTVVAAKNSEVKSELEAIGGKEVSVSDIELIKGEFLRLGHPLEKSIQVIIDGHAATKTMLDKYGEEHIEPDHDKRLKAALIYFELVGIIKNKQVATDNSKHTHVTYSWQPVQIVNTPVEGGRVR